MAGEQKDLPEIAIEFGEEEWREEVERFRPSAVARVQAQRARRMIEADTGRLAWKRCRAESADGTRLPHCLKLRVPLDEQGASAAPFGFVFELQRKADDGLMLNFLAFGERHPSPSQGQFKMPTVYERAHKRLHGHYPQPAPDALDRHRRHPPTLAGRLPCDHPTTDHERPFGAERQPSRCRLRSRPNRADQTHLTKLLGRPWPTMAGDRRPSLRRVPAGPTVGPPCRPPTRSPATRPPATPTT